MEGWMNGQTTEEQSQIHRTLSVARVYDNPNFTNPWVMHTDLKVNRLNPTESLGTDEQKHQFYANLKKAIVKKIKNLSGEVTSTQP